MPSFFLYFLIWPHVGVEQTRQNVYQFCLNFKCNFMPGKCIPIYFDFFFFFVCLRLLLLCRHVFDTVYSAYFIRWQIVRHQIRIYKRLWITFAGNFSDLEFNNTAQCYEIMRPCNERKRVSFQFSVFFSLNQCLWTIRRNRKKNG